jgi:hypothetical protein
MVSQGRRLRALHIFEPPQVFAGELAECHTMPPTLLGFPLEQRLLDIVLAHQRQHSRRRHGFRQHALRSAAGLPAPAAVAVRLHPGASERAYDRPPVA